jgi:hypothetical protein
VTDDATNMPMTRQLVNQDEHSESETGSVTSEVSPTREDKRNPAWAPETEYLRRKLLPRNEGPVGRVPTTPYAFRSRPARTQDRETEQIEPRNKQSPAALSWEGPAEEIRDQPEAGSYTPTTH